MALNHSELVDGFVAGNLIHIQTIAKHNKLSMRL